MTSESTSGLRLHIEDHCEQEPSLGEATFGPIGRAFEQATGWQLRLEQTPRDRARPGPQPLKGWSDPRDASSWPCRRATTSRPAAPMLDLHQVRSLALAIGGLLGEINSLRHAVWRREAELAAGVPVASRPEGEAHLAERLEAVLKAGVEAIGGQAAGLYLLDEGTTELKLRATFGLPPERLLAPGRPLRGSVADLEALVGHAVVLEDTALLPHWRCPEDYPSAVCLPVSSPSIPLGTLWVFSEEPRDFTPQETNLLEIIAGRLAADLEREMLLAAGKQAKQRDKQLDVAARWMHDRLPSVAPLVEGYEIAGWTQAADEIGGDFHDWLVLPDGRVSLVVGDADGALLEAALSAATLQAATKSHAGYRHTAGELLTRINESLIAASPGDQRSVAGLCTAGRRQRPN